MGSPLQSPLQSWWSLPVWQRLRWASIRLRTALGIPVRMDSPDRALIERTLMPYYAARPELRRILFVGCDWYTKHYHRLFGAGREFHTMDLDPRQARFGGPRHLEVPVQDAARHFAAGHFDLVICNGVFGYGLDQRADVVAGFAACLTVLRTGGEFLLGWNDVSPHAPFDPSEAASAAGFEPIVLAPLGRWRTVLEMPTRHVFEAYRKPTTGSPSNAAG